MSAADVFVTAATNSLNSLNRTRQFLFALSSAIAIASIGSHFVAKILRIRTGGVEYKLLGERNGKPLAFAEGSSLMVEGLAWQRVSQKFEVGIENWFVAGSSPSEWEVLQTNARNANLTFIAVSAYDLNEGFLCDSRSRVVPLSQTIKDLRQSRADWHFAKRLLSQYPQNYVRLVFPTVGRSDGVMVGVREKLSGLLKFWVSIEAEAGPNIGSASGPTINHPSTERVSDWTPSRLLRRLALMRSACQGRHSFAGPKKLALLRMLNNAQQQGRVIVIVLPVSPLYAGQFLPPEVVEEFEITLTEAQRNTPEALWLRLDRIPELYSNDYFWDLVHMNAEGQQIATEALLNARFKPPAAQ